MRKENYHSDTKLGKKLDVAAYILTAIILLIVGLMRRYKFETSIDFGFLPPFNAVCNTIVAIALIFALYFIRNGNVKKHRRAINVAFVFSFLFLLSYVIYHFTTIETVFCKEGVIKSIYMVILFSHIILAGVSLPFILLTFIRGYTQQIEKHKRLARWVWPIWFYVAVSGPVCYLLLNPCYS